MQTLSAMSSSGRSRPLFLTPFLLPVERLTFLIPPARSCWDAPPEKLQRWRCQWVAELDRYSVPKSVLIASLLAMPAPLRQQWQRPPIVLWIRHGKSEDPAGCSA